MTRNNLILLFVGSVIMLACSFLGVQTISRLSLENSSRSILMLTYMSIFLLGFVGLIFASQRLYLELSYDVVFKELTIDWIEQTVDSGFTMINIGLAVTIFPYNLIQTKLETYEIPDFTFVDDRKRDWLEGDKIKVKLYLKNGVVQEYVLL